MKPEENIAIGQGLVPNLNVNVPSVPEESQTNSLIQDEQLLGVYQEIFETIRKDREEIDEVLQHFTDVVVNNGDASSASKEAVVNLIKIKSDTADKMAKVADLMTRVKLKERDTFPRYLAANQTNTFNIGKISPEEKRRLIQQEQEQNK